MGIRKNKSGVENIGSSHEKNMEALLSDEIGRKHRENANDEFSLRAPEKIRSEFETSLEIFKNELDKVLLARAQDKGYHSKGLNGRQLYDFVHDLASNGHALGEIIYKAIRFNRRKNMEDLVKIAAWSFLIWDKTRREE